MVLRVVSFTSYWVRVASYWSPKVWCFIKFYCFAKKITRGMVMARVGKYVVDIRCVLIDIRFKLQSRFVYIISYFEIGEKYGPVMVTVIDQIERFSFCCSIAN